VRAAHPHTPEEGTPARAGHPETLSAVTLACADLDRSVRFYTDLGFSLRDGSHSGEFATFCLGGAFLNLQLDPSFLPGRTWGRVIVWVDDVDATYHRALLSGHTPDFAPEDAPWGERYFHLRDPDGHELSFARPVAH